MLVYGDQMWTRDPRAALERLRAALDDVDARLGLARHTALVAVFIEAGELAQGLADAAFE
ncbi:MAG: hypothetical protein H0T79_17540, partial [Deltaproteobacteria bacterium]|nr:hypothetical protein [Deltaproteobacteria bacterium]